MRHILIGLVLLACALPVWSQTCDVTVSTCGALQSNVSSGLGTAKTICLNDGSYGTCQLADMSRTALATVRCVNALACSMSVDIFNSDFIRIQDITIVSGGDVAGCSTNIQIANSTVSPNDSGLFINGADCPTTAQNIVIDNVDFTDANQGSLYEGRLNIRDGNTVQVQNSLFAGVGSQPSDGIQTVGAARSVTIGPGNIFADIQQAACDPTHCDNIQIFGSPCTNVIIEKNWFRDGSTLILTESDCQDGIVRNNIFSSISSIQFHEWGNLIFEHNTLYNSALSMNGTASNPPSAELRSNIWHNSSVSFADYDGGGPGVACTACNMTFNLHSSGCQGTDCITGTPTYTAGSPPPSTWAGWQLANGSAGENNAHDGLDRGTLYYGSGNGEMPTLIWLIRKVGSLIFWVIGAGLLLGAFHGQTLRWTRGAAGAVRAVLVLARQGLHTATGRRA